MRLELWMLLLCGVLLVCVLVLGGMWWRVRRRREAGHVFVRRWGPMNDAHLRAAFAAWPDDVRWRAVWEVLSRELEAELQNLARVKDEPSSVMRWAGRIETLLLLRTQFQNLHRREIGKRDDAEGMAGADV